MTPNIIKRNIAQSQSAGFYMSKEALELLKGILPVNAPDGASSRTVKRKPLAVRTDSYSLTEFGASTKSYRLQTTIGDTSYKLIQGATNWMLDSEKIEAPVDTSHPKDKEVHLIQVDGFPLIIKVNTTVTASSYDVEQGQFNDFSLPAGLASATSLSATVHGSGEVMITDGTNVYSTADSLSRSFALTTSGSDFAIESLGDKAICWTSNGSVSTFHILTPTGVDSSFTATTNGSYRGSNLTPSGMVVYMEAVANYHAVEANLTEIVGEYSIAKADIESAGIDGINEFVAGVYWYQGGSADILSVTITPDRGGNYYLRSRSWDGTAIGTSSDILSHTDSNVKYTKILGSPDVYTWGSRTPLHVGGTVIVDHSYIPSSILIPSSGGASSGGGGGSTPTLQEVTDAGAVTTNNITVNGLTASLDPIDALGDLRARSNIRFDAYAPLSGHNLLIVGTDGTLYSRDENYYTTQSWVTSQGYATQSWVNSQGYATQTWVNAQGFVDENLSSLSFNVADGVLTATLSGGTQTTVDLDGRYLQSVSLNDLTDVDAASNKNDGAVMQWSAVLNRFVLSNTLDLRIEGDDLTADNTPTAGQVYQYNGSTFQWATVTSGGVTSLNDIGDVSVPSPSTNDVLTWNGSTWAASAAGGGAADGVVTGASFSGGTLTLTRSLSLSDVTVDLDGRYLQSYTETDPTGVASLAFSGTSTKTLTITLNNGSTRTATFTDLQGGGGSVADGVVNGASFNTSNGELTLNRTEGLSDVVVDLDGRYSTFTSFFVKADNSGSGSIFQNNTLQLTGGAGISTVRTIPLTGYQDITFNIEDNGVTESMLNIANSPTSGRYLMYDAGDLVWAPLASAVQAADAWSSSIQSISVNSSTWSRVENYTTFGQYDVAALLIEDPTQDGRFSVRQGGVYEITYRVRLGLTSVGESYRAGISENGGTPSEKTTSDSKDGVGNLQMTFLTVLNTLDYFELQLLSTKTETINTNKVYLSVKRLSDFI
jgi:hypothetical protein